MNGTLTIQSLWKTSRDSLSAGRISHPRYLSLARLENSSRQTYRCVTNKSAGIFRSTAMFRPNSFQSFVVSAVREKWPELPSFPAPTSRSNRVVTYTEGCYHQHCSKYLLQKLFSCRLFLGLSTAVLSRSFSTTCHSCATLRNHHFVAFVRTHKARA